MRVLVMHGPNLNLLGRRQPEIYGEGTLAELDQSLVDLGERLGASVETMQSNHEGDLLDALHEGGYDGVILNPGALAHTSRALADAISAIDAPVVEVHISNIAEREPWRAVSFIADECVATVYGRGRSSYRDALRHLVNRRAMPVEEIDCAPGPRSDLRRGSGKPLVVLLHGGFWREEYGRDTMETLAVRLAQRGHTTLNAGYRPARAGWEAMAEDVLCAIRRGREAAGDGPYALVGHSAGGYLALWAATEPSIPQPGLVIALAPVTDLEGHASTGAFGSDEAYGLIEGGAPVRPQPEAPTLVVQPSSDDLVPTAPRPEGSEPVPAEGGHFDLLDPDHPVWAALARRLEDI